MTKLGRRAAWLLLLAALPMFSGCSAMGTRYLRLGFPIVYEHADFLIGWEADTYFDLDAEQRAWLSKQVMAQQAWHRKTQLPKYSATLAEVARTASQRGIEPADLQRLENAFRSWYDDTSAQGLDVMGQLFLRVSDAQVAHFRAELETLNKKAIDDAAERTPADRRDELVDRYESMMGDLSPAQLRKVDVAAASLQAEDPFRLVYWKRWQGDLFALLARRRAAPACFITQFKDMATHRDRWYTPELSRVRAHNEQIQRELAQALLTDLSSAQRAQFVKKANDWKELFAGLAGKAGNGVVLVPQRTEAGASACAASVEAGGKRTNASASGA